MNNTKTISCSLFLLICSLMIHPVLWADSQCDPWAAIVESIEGKAGLLANGQTTWTEVSVNDTLCYGDTLRIIESRAAIKLENQTLVRLKEGTIVKFIPPKDSFWLELIEGAAHFISRTPKKMIVKAPYMNAAVDGTEFVVVHDLLSDTLAVFEGQVTASNDLGSIQLQSMEQINVSDNAPPSGKVPVTIEGIVSWALQYPPLFITSPSIPNAVYQQLNNAEYTQALNLLEQFDPNDVHPDAALLRANIGLVTGDIELVKFTIAKTVQSAESEAISTLITLTEGDSQKALARSSELVSRYPQSPAALIVHSFCLQSQFHLEDALSYALKAAEIQGNSEVIWNRVAELALIFNNGKLTKQAIEKSLILNPNSSSAQALYGFYQMKSFRYKKALKYFNKAVAADNNNSFSRFALGLIKIRLGDLVAGREQIELAILLDPNNSVYRSYLGKAYLDEDRLDDAQDQFDMAISFDPNDPTSYFYSAVVNQQKNQTGSAIVNLHSALKKNPNRKVLRSEEQITSDSIAKISNLSKTFVDVEAFDRARLLASGAIWNSPREYSGHRMLAESLVDENQLDSARASEVFQGQLRQPLTGKPISSLLKETGIVTSADLGPTSLGLSEFNPLFNRNDLTVEADAVHGSNNTDLQHINLSGLKDNFSFGTSYYKFGSDGFRENNNSEYEIASASVHYKPTETVGFILERVSRDEESGDLNPTTLEGFFSNEKHTQIGSDTLMLGLNINVHRHLEILATQTFYENQFDQTDLVIQQDLGLELDSVFNQKAKINEQQLQANYSFQDYLIIIGGKRSKIDSVEDSVLSLDSFPLFTAESVRSVDHIDAYYAYTHLKKMFTGIDSLIGVKKIDSGSGVDDGKEDYKFGLSVTPTIFSTIRFAAFSSTINPSERVQSLEPTNIFGFLQYYDGINLSKSENLALGLDFEMNKRSYLGFEHINRRIKSIEESGFTRSYDSAQSSIFVEFYADSSSHVVRYVTFNEDLKNLGENTSNLPVKSKFAELQVSNSFSIADDMKFAVKLRWLDQLLGFATQENEPSSDLDQNKSIVDVSFDYNLPTIQGIKFQIEAEVKNLLDTELNYQYNSILSDGSPRAFGINPERYFQIQLSISH